MIWNFFFKSSITVFIQLKIICYNYIGVCVPSNGSYNEFMMLYIFNFQLFQTHQHQQANRRVSLTHLLRRVAQVLVVLGTHDSSTPPLGPGKSLYLSIPFRTSSFTNFAAGWQNTLTNHIYGITMFLICLGNRISTNKSSRQPKHEHYRTINDTMKQFQRVVSVVIMRSISNQKRRFVCL